VENRPGAAASSHEAMLTPTPTLHADGASASHAANPRDLQDSAHTREDNRDVAPSASRLRDDRGERRGLSTLNPDRSRQGEACEIPSHPRAWGPRRYGGRIRRRSAGSDAALPYKVPEAIQDTSRTISFTWRPSRRDRTPEGWKDHPVGVFHAHDRDRAEIPIWRNRAGRTTALRLVRMWGRAERPRRRAEADAQVTAIGPDKRRARVESSASAPGC